MTNKTNSNGKRTDSGSRVIKASPQSIYQAFLDPEAVVSWRPPAGMKAQIFKFEPWEGGAFRMSFSYTDTSNSTAGKTSGNEDVFQGHFRELRPNVRIVEEVEFESDDPAFAGTMQVITSLEPVAECTKVTFTCENVPMGISAEDHEEGIASSLENLANFTERS
jgi:uncharacterized protein YndB with AHSA1/START domain